jgi:hypothetical protein
VIEKDKLSNMAINFCKKNITELILIKLLISIGSTLDGLSIQNPYTTFVLKYMILLIFHLFDFSSFKQIFIKINKLNLKYI